ncbi:MAG: thioredoxin domain-containing protein [Anaerolineales bacterium]|nr:thioredoxin domain-containing protein [Anaerolineales bacterium]
MEIDSSQPKQNNISTSISLVSSVIVGLVCIILGFGVWYFGLRPENEIFPFSRSQLELLFVIAFSGMIGFWLGPKLMNYVVKRNYQLGILGVFTGLLLFTAGVGVGYIIRDNQMPSEADNTDTSAGEITIPENIKRYEVSVDDDPVYGSEDAEITIIQFADFECPYCTKWQFEVWPEIMKAFPGQVRLVYRDFPLYGLHANAESAAEAADCAGEQNAYWEYHNALFVAEHGLGAEAFIQYADELNLDGEKFSECLESNRFVDEVKADYEYAANLGVNSAPTFFVNGIPIVGAQPYSVFQQLITKELAGEIPK